MRQLTIVAISDSHSRLTCEGGMVRNKRNGGIYSEVVCRNEDINDYESYG